MKNDLNRLYPEIIKNHNETPFHFEKVNNAPITLKAYNPICGDRFELYIEKSHGIINELHFHGFGCAISKAATSVLVKSLSGKPVAEALIICNNFLDFIDKKSSQHDLTIPDDFLAFSGVHEFPERYDCATLSCKEMKKYLES